MKHLSTLFATALLTISASAALADTITIGSYGTKQGTTTYTAPSSYKNTALSTNPHGGGNTFDLPTGGIWTAPIGSSSWVGVNPQDYPGGSNQEPNGLYDYFSTFDLSSLTGVTGSIQVMADDTMDVYLNGKLLQTAAPPVGAAHCTKATPNCIVPTTVALSGFILGSNTLELVDHQDFLNAAGVDFEGTVGTGVTPEPSSLLLLGSGLTGMAGMFFRRRQQA